MMDVESEAVDASTETTGESIVDQEDDDEDDNNPELQHQVHFNNSKVQLHHHPPPPPLPDDAVALQLHAADAPSIRRNALWAHFLFGKHHKRSGYKEAYCRACVDAGIYEPIRGDNPRIWRHLRTCPQFDAAALARLMATGEYDKFSHVPRKSAAAAGGRKATTTADHAKHQQPQIYMLNPSTSTHDLYHLESTTLPASAFDLTRKSVVHWTPPPPTPVSTSSNNLSSSSGVQTDEEFAAYVVMQLKQYPEPARSLLKKTLKREMAKFCLDNIEYMQE